MIQSVPAAVQLQESLAITYQQSSKGENVAVMIPEQVEPALDINMIFVPYTAELLGYFQYLQNGLPLKAI